MTTSFNNTFTLTHIFVHFYPPIKKPPRERPNLDYLPFCPLKATPFYDVAYESFKQNFCSSNNCLIIRTYMFGFERFKNSLIFYVLTKHFIYFIQAMEELRKFMIVKTLPSKNRQKLMRNLRVCIWQLLV